MTSENIGGDPLNVAATEADNQPVAQTPAVEAEASLPVIDEQAETEESQPEASDPQPQILETEAEESQVEQPVIEADASQPEVPEPQPDILEAEPEEPQVEQLVVEPEEPQPEAVEVDDVLVDEQPAVEAPEPQPEILEAEVEAEELQVEQPIVEPEPQPEAVEVDDVLVDEQPAVEAPEPQPEILEAEVEAEELQVEQPVVEPEQPQPEAVEVDDVLVDEQPAVEAAQPVRPNRLRRALGAVALLVAVAGTAFGAAYAYDQLTDEDAVETTITEDEPVTTITAAATTITFEDNSVTNQDNRLIIDCGNDMAGSDNVVNCSGVANPVIEQSVPVVVTAAEDDANRPAEITVIDNSQTVQNNTSETDCGNDMEGSDNVVQCSGVANPVIEQSPTPAEADEVEESKPQPIKVVQKVIQEADESVTQKVTVEEDKGIEVVQEVVKPIEKEPAPTKDEEKCYSGDQEVDCPW